VTSTLQNNMLLDILLYYDQIGINLSEEPGAHIFYSRDGVGGMFQNLRTCWPYHKMSDPQTN